MNRYIVHLQINNTASQIEVDADSYTINEKFLRFYCEVEDQEDPELTVSVSTGFIVYVNKEEKK